MKLPTSLVLAFSYLSLTSAASISQPEGNLDSLEKRGCFTTGTEWGSQKSAAYRAATEACDGPLQGTYQKGQTRTRCYNIGGGKQAVFTISLRGPKANGPRHIGGSECRDQIGGRIGSCHQNRGDEKTYDYWYFR